MPTPFLQIPNAVWASAGAAEGDTELNAFDNALLAAQVGNLNLIRVSSVLPQDATVLVVGRFDPTEASLEDRARGCLEGAKGRLEVELPPRRLLSLLLPESLLRSESFR